MGSLIFDSLGLTAHMSIVAELLKKKKKKKKEEKIIIIVVIIVDTVMSS